MRPPSCCRWGRLSCRPRRDPSCRCPPAPDLAPRRRQCHRLSTPASRPAPPQVPCSWGALFFGSHWRDFLKFYALRVRPPFFDFAQEATQRGVGKHREPLGERAARHGARALLCSRPSRGWCWRE